MRLYVGRTAGRLKLPSAACIVNRDFQAFFVAIVQKILSFPMAYPTPKQLDGLARHSDKRYLHSFAGCNYGLYKVEVLRPWDNLRRHGEAVLSLLPGLVKLLKHTLRPSSGCRQPPYLLRI